jgi:hypothetical protein
VVNFIGTFDYFGDNNCRSLPAANPDGDLRLANVSKNAASR